MKCFIEWFPEPLTYIYINGAIKKRRHIHLTPVSIPDWCQTNPNHLNPVNLHSLYEFHNEHKFKGSNLIIFNGKFRSYSVQCERTNISYWTSLAALTCTIILLMILRFHIFCLLMKVLVRLSLTSLGCKEFQNIFQAKMT